MSDSEVYGVGEVVYVPRHNGEINRNLDYWPGGKAQIVEVLGDVLSGRFKYEVRRWVPRLQAWTQRTYVIGSEWPHRSIRAFQEGRYVR